MSEYNLFLWKGSLASYGYTKGVFGGIRLLSHGILNVFIYFSMDMDMDMEYHLFAQQHCCVVSLILCLRCQVMCFNLSLFPTSPWSSLGESFTLCYV